jgi:hypothetical protein
LNNGSYESQDAHLKSCILITVVAVQILKQ